MNNETNCSAFFELFKKDNITRLDIPFECEKYPMVVEVVLGIILFIIAAGSIGGNFLVILAVGLVKKLQTPSNILIVNLAVSDFLVSILVMPIAVYNQLVRFRWPFNDQFCDAFLSFDVLLCTSSILNLCAISIDRYLVITKPMQYASKRTPALMGAMIACAWIISSLISIPPLIGFKKGFKPGSCEYSDNIYYQIYATFFAFYIPLIIMLVLYYRIFKLARKMAQEDTKRNLGTLVMNNDEENSAPARVNSITTDDNNKLLRFQKHRSSSGDKENNIDNFRNSGSSRKTLLKNKGKKAKSNSDTKAIKTLGFIMGCFTLCWLPFFIMQILKSILVVAAVPYEDILLPWLYELFLWLGYFNSFLNPVIYAKFNREFRNPFKEIILCHCANINARLRSESYAEQYGLPTRRTTTTSYAVHYDASTQNTHQSMNNRTNRRRSSDPFTMVSKKNKLLASQSKQSQNQIHKGS